MLLPSIEPMKEETIEGTTSSQWARTWENGFIGDWKNNISMPPPRRWQPHTRFSLARVTWANVDGVFAIGRTWFQTLRPSFHATFGRNLRTAEHRYRRGTVKFHWRETVKSYATPGDRRFALWPLGAIWIQGRTFERSDFAAYRRADSWANGCYSYSWTGIYEFLRDSRLWCSFFEEWPDVSEVTSLVAAR